MEESMRYIGTVRCVLCDHRDVRKDRRGTGRQRQNILCECPLTLDLRVRVQTQLDLWSGGMARATPAPGAAGREAVMEAAAASTKERVHRAAQRLRLPVRPGW